MNFNISLWNKSFENNKTMGAGCNIAYLTADSHWLELKRKLNGL